MLKIVTQFLRHAVSRREYLEDEIERLQGDAEELERDIEWLRSGFLGERVVDSFDAHLPQGMSPRVSAGIYEKAGDMIPMNWDQYLLLFEHFPWSSQYGGRPWAQIANAGKRLEQVQRSGNGWEEASVWIDHAFDLEHNTGSLFSKSPELNWVRSALNRKLVLPPYALLSKASPDVRKLFQKYMRSTGGAASWRAEVEQMREQKKKQLLDQLQSTAAIPMNLRRVMDNAVLTPRDFASTPQFNIINLGYYHPSGLDKLLYRMDAPRRFLDYFPYSPPDQFINTLKSLENGVFESFTALAVPIWQKLSNHSDFNTEIQRFMNSAAGQNTRWHSPTTLMQNLMGWLEFFNSISAKTAQMERELTPEKFFDFYLLTVIDPAGLYPEDASILKFLRQDLAADLVQQFVEYIHNACVREARHVKDYEAISEYVTDGVEADIMDKERELEGINQDIEELQQELDELDWAENEEMPLPGQSPEMFQPIRHDQQGSVQSPLQG